jgi:hypothetical protein
VTLAAEIRMDNTQAPERTFRLLFTPLSRVAFESQPFSSSRMDVVIPSQFTVSLLPSTDYMVELFSAGGTPDAYLKDVTCDGTIRRNRIKLGDTDCGLHITVGTDMGIDRARHNPNFNSVAAGQILRRSHAPGSAGLGRVHPNQSRPARVVRDSGTIHIAISAKAQHGALARPID